MKSLCLAFLLAIVSSSSIAATTSYDIDVKTTDVKDAGTDADVWIIIVGKNGKKTEKISLDNKDKNDHEKNTLTKHVNKIAEDVGEVASIELGHNNKEKQPGWKPEFVDIRVGGKNYRAEVNTWLANDEGPLFKTEGPFAAKVH